MSMEDIEQRLGQISDRLCAIEERNRRVEREKAWETSVVRRISVLVLTYFVMCLVFTALQGERVLTSAIIPTLGFFLSTLSLPAIRRWWQRRLH